MPHAWCLKLLHKDTIGGVKAHDLWEIGIIQRHFVGFKKRCNSGLLWWHCSCENGISNTFRWVRLVSVMHTPRSRDEILIWITASPTAHVIKAMFLSYFSHDKIFLKDGTKRMTWLDTFNKLAFRICRLKLNKNIFLMIPNKVST